MALHKPIQLVNITECSNEKHASAISCICVYIFIFYDSYFNIHASFRINKEMILILRVAVIHIKSCL